MISAFQAFLKAPELCLTSEVFPYKTFTTTEENWASESIEFPSKLLLGKQAEYLFEAYIKHSERYRLLANNIQIQGKTETLGELDYLVFDKALQKTIHIELACKFYLLDESLGTSIEEKWIGPNRNDTLYDKLEKLKTKQFPLLFEKETQKILQNLSIDVSEIEQQLCLKSFLFIPENFAINAIPDNYKECVIGSYVRFENFKTKENVQYAMPNKKEWLLPTTEINNWFSASEIEQMVSKEIQKKKSPLLYIKHYSKIEKVFVVWW